MIVNFPPLTFAAAIAVIACCIHTHYGLEITGAYTFAGLYSAASESTTYYSPIVRNDGASLGVVGTLNALAGGSGYINGAYNAREEGIKGSITAGKLADFVVLADDFHTVDKAKIKDIQIVRTVVGGKTVYQA